MIIVLRYIQQQNKLYSSEKNYTKHLIGEKQPTLEIYTDEMYSKKMKNKYAWIIKYELKGKNYIQNLYKLLKFTKFLMYTYSRLTLGCIHKHMRIVINS